MTDQEEYAKTQHDLCCQELGLEPRHDRPGDTLLEAVASLKKDRDEWKEESALHQKEHERLAKKIDAIETKALEIIPGYGNTGKSTFSTPIAVMGRMRDEIDLLRGELKKADEALEANITTFIDLREERDAARACAVELRESLCRPEWAKPIVFPWEKPAPSLDSENA